MLNTSGFANNNNANAKVDIAKANTNLIKNIANETIVDKSIREIEDKTGNDKNIVESFHSMENNIFSKGLKPQDDPFKVDNFKFDEITQKYGDDEIVKNIYNNEKKLLISINEKLGKISIYDEKNTPLGYFTISHIMKYLGDVYDTKQQFLTDLDAQIYQKSKAIIKALIFKLQYNKKNKYVDINILDYTKSGFMGDIELLIKLNNLLYKYQKETLYAELSKVDISNRIKIEQNVKKFIFMLLNYTLKLIAVISDKVKDNNDLKNKLLNYSIGITYRINLFVQEQLKVIKTQNDNIGETLKKNLEVKNELKGKLDILIENVRGNKPSTQSRNHKPPINQSDLPRPVIVPIPSQSVLHKPMIVPVSFGTMPTQSMHVSAKSQNVQAIPIYDSRMNIQK